jgi:hypothetical protein
MVGSTFSNETGINAAILRYAGAPDTQPTTTQTGHRLFEEQDLVVRNSVEPLSVTDWIVLHIVNRASPGSRGDSRCPT